jgi:hypothetical protein
MFYDQAHKNYDEAHGSLPALILHKALAVRYIRGLANGRAGSYGIGFMVLNHMEWNGMGAIEPQKSLLYVLDRKELASRKESVYKQVRPILFV